MCVLFKSTVVHSPAVERLLFSATLLKQTIQRKQKQNYNSHRHALKNRKEVRISIIKHLKKNYSPSQAHAHTKMNGSEGQE